jgi:hypothetical protein
VKLAWDTRYFFFKVSFHYLSLVEGFCWEALEKYNIPDLLSRNEVVAAEFLENHFDWHHDDLLPFREFHHQHSHSDEFLVK